MSIPRLPLLAVFVFAAIVGSALLSACRDEEKPREQSADWPTIAARHCDPGYFYLTNKTPDFRVCVPYKEPRE